MYVHYGCRCEECCRAEHQQYLKRQEAKARNRTNSKWGTPVLQTEKATRKRHYYAERYKALKERKSTHTHWIAWQEIADMFDRRCAICGNLVDANDTWIGENGRICYGRNYPTVDHIIPLKYGGTDTLDNVQLLCKHCNSAKGTKQNAC